MLATIGPDSSSPRVSPEKESISNLAKFRGFAGTILAPATTLEFLLRSAATRSSQKERRPPQAPWPPDPMWPPRRSLLQTIAAPRRSDKKTSTENCARSARTSRSARGHKESFGRGRLRQLPAPEDRIVRKCAQRKNSAIALCNIARPP